MRPSRQRDRGVTAVLFLVVLTAVGAFLALVMNVGMILDARGKLQNASDAAAHAAAWRLDKTKDGLLKARADAVTHTSQHGTIGGPAQIQAADVQFGAWHFLAAECTYGETPHKCFEPIPDASWDTEISGTPNFVRVNAAWVRNGHDGQAGHNSTLRTVFGAFLSGGGSSDVTVRSEAIAVGNGAVVECTLPFTLAACQALKDDGALDCGGGVKTLQFSNDNKDNLGFINLFGGSANIDQVRDHISDPNRCAVGQEGDDGRVQDSAAVQNGNGLQPVIDALLGIDKKGDATGVCVLGRDEAVSIASVDCPGGNPKFNQKHPVVGFAKVRIAEITCANGTVITACPAADVAKACSGGGGGGGGGDKGKGGKDDGGKPEKADKLTLKLEILCGPPPAPGKGPGGGPFLRLVK